MLIVKSNQNILKVVNDEITLSNSKIFELNSKINELKIQYDTYFGERIVFYTQNITDTEINGINDLLNNEFYIDYRNRLNVLENYNSNVEWSDTNDKKILFELYNTLISKITINLQTQWSREFDHPILSSKKIDYLTIYFDNKLLALYGVLNKFILDNEYSYTISDYIHEETKQLVSTFAEITKLSFQEHRDITIHSDMFDYDKLFKFRISEDIELEENVNKTFISILNTTTRFVLDKNIKFKTLETDTTNLLKINSVWNDMEKKYV